jgi:plasmid stabilization system protein ParE
MAKAIEYLRGARVDFDESFDWYAERSVDAAIGFAAAVEEAIDKVIADPRRFPSTHGRCQYCSLRRYPFRLVFRDEPDRLVVVAVAHAKRRPGYWHARTDPAT